jgi:hypothetical protein
MTLNWPSSPQLKRGPLPASTLVRVERAAGPLVVAELVELSFTGDDYFIKR